MAKRVRKPQPRKTQRADTERDEPIVLMGVTAQDMNAAVTASEAGNLENLTLVQKATFLPFRGGMDITRDRYQLPLGGFSAIQNMRPLRPGFETRKGCRKLHTTAEKATASAMSLYMFSKGKVTERKFIAQWNDGDIQIATNAPPAVTTGNFSAADLFASGTTGLVPASWAMFNDILICTDGTGAPLTYPGTASPVSRFIVVKDTAAHGMMPLNGEDYTTEVTDGNTGTVAVLDSLSVLTDHDAAYIMTDTPADTFTFTVSKANGDAAVAQLHYCTGNGAWSAVSSLTDNTIASAGKTLGQTGTMTFTMPTDIKPTYMFAKTGYWYRLSLSSGALDAEVEISAVSYEGDMLRMHNVFDDVPSSAIEGHFFDNATTTYQFYSGSAISVGGMTSSDKLYFNFTFPVEAIYVDVGNTPNEEGSTTLTLKYWNGSSWASLSTVTDGTGGLAKSGWITFARPSDWQKSIFRSDSYYSYWIELTSDSTLTTSMVISLEGAPFFDFDDFGNAVSCCSWKNRMVYSFDKVPGYILITADGAPFSLNGSDLAIRDIGDGRANKAVCIKRFYNDIMVWQEEKGKEGGCLTMIQGYSPQNFGKLLLSSRYGTFSAKSAIVVDDCPYYEKDREDDPRFLGSRAIAFWLSREGVFMSNGKNVTNISHESIRPYFDPASSSCIRRGYENKHWIEYDSRHRGLRIGLVTGSSATEPNTFLFYDIVDAAWSSDSLAQAFACIAEIEADSGDVPAIQVAAGAGDGFIYQTNYGTADVTSAIDNYATMEVSAQNSIIEMIELVLRCRVQSAGSVEITPYINGYAQTARSVLMTALVTNDGMRRNRIGVDLKGEHLSFRFRNATANESMVLYDVGFIVLADGRK